MSNKIIYVLSSSDSAGGSMFLVGPAYSNADRTSILDQITKDLYSAKTFGTEKEAWEQRELCVSSGWQITRIDAKRMFKGKLSK